MEGDPMVRHARTLAALAAVTAILSLPRPGAAFGLDLACGLLLYPVPSDSAYVEYVACPVAWTGLVVGFAAAAPALVTLPVLPDDIVTGTVGSVAFLTAHATAGAVLLPAYFPVRLLKEPDWCGTRSPRTGAS
jgi:hypothetical protein